MQSQSVSAPLDRHYWTYRYLVDNTQASAAASSGPEAESWEWTDAFGGCCMRDRRSLINNNE